MPRKTLTALEPVTLPIDASAYWSWIAATLLANVSGQTKKGREEDQIYEQALHFLSTHVAQLILFKSNLLSCNYEHVTFSVKITFSHLKTQIPSFEDLTDRTSLGTRWICKLFFFHLLWYIHLVLLPVWQTLWQANHNRLFNMGWVWYMDFIYNLRFDTMFCKSVGAWVVKFCCMT